MSNVVLTLGGVPFQDMEVPEKISFGGKQRVAVQNLIGGGRVVSALGIDDGKISFSGIFSGSDAVSRAQLLDAARALGASIPLVWDSFFYTVVIEGFTAEYRKTNLIPFSITCVVVNDPLASLAALTAPIANLIGNDLSVASALSGQAGFSLAGLSAIQRRWFCFRAGHVGRGNRGRRIGTRCGGIHAQRRCGCAGGGCCHECDWRCVLTTGGTQRHEWVCQSGGKQSDK